MALNRIFLLALCTSPIYAQLVNTTLAGLAGVLGVNQTFDYVVVGAGTAGSALAYRLAENPAISVALIEAGTYYEVSNPLLSSTPAGDVVFVGSNPEGLDRNPVVDWNFVTVPQTGAGDRNVAYCRGKCLGGTSARNFMIYQRGTKQSFDVWANQVGDSSYTFQNVLPFYKKSVDFTPPNTSKREANASASYNPAAFSPGAGPLKVSYANYAQTFSTYLSGAFAEIGTGIAQDFNSGVLQGGQYCSSTIDPANENRASSQETFLTAAAAAGFPNLKIFDNALAKKILFNGTTATGVNVAALGALPFNLNARREVIVSAGAFNSPQLLMVSGIGPKATLNKFNIPVLVDNPNVGQNMWDHIFAGPTYRVNVETFTRLANDPAYILEQFLGPYSTQQEGPLTNPVSDYLAWEKVPYKYRRSFTASALADLAKFPADWPELEFISGAGYVGDFASLITTQPKDGFMYATLLSTLVAPLSRGSVTLASADTSVLPVIDPAWLTSTTDQQVAIAAYKRAREVFHSRFMQQIVIGDEYFPGANVTSDADILKVYQETLMTVWHAACTCKMGRVGDSTAVVDPRARVMGVKNLRVVDASAFAILPPGHPQSTVYMLAEKIANDILTKGST